jgi:hypothetical protein
MLTNRVMAVCVKGKMRQKQKRKWEVELTCLLFGQRLGGDERQGSDISFLQQSEQAAQLSGKPS